MFGAPTAASAAFKTGIWDDWFTSTNDARRAQTMDRAAGTGADLVRINVPWRSVVGASPPTDPASPTDPAYDFTALDAGVRDAAARGLDVMFTLYSAPGWAEGSDRPKDLNPDWIGVWKPDSEAFGRFGQALARRYSGSFPDPIGLGSSLPRVQYFDSWNEPNLLGFLGPQVENGRRVGARIYRSLVNELAVGVKSVHQNNKIVGPSTAPFGGPYPTPGTRTRPVQFDRDLLCLKGREKLKPDKCPKSRRARIDIFSHHPIALPFQGPDYNAINPDDASSGDLERVGRVLRAAERAGTILPAGRRPLWATEFWWQSDPPVRDAPSWRKQARWVQQSLYVFWRDGAQAAFYFDLIDTTNRGSGNFGLIARDFTLKPSYRAFKFPFVARRTGTRRVKAWGRAPVGGELRIQRRDKGGWRTLKQLNVGDGGVFTSKLSLRGKAELRAVVGDQRSLAWRHGG